MVFNGGHLFLTILRTCGRQQQKVSYMFGNSECTKTGGLDLDPPGTARQGLAWPCRLLSILMSSHGKRGFTVVENCGETQKNEKELGDDKTETVS